MRARRTFVLRIAPRADLPGLWLDLRAHEVGAAHQFIETRTAEAERSSAEHSLDAAPQDHGVDRRFQGG